MSTGWGAGNCFHYWFEPNLRSECVKPLLYIICVTLPAFCTVHSPVDI